MWLRLAAFDWPEERKRSLYAAMQRGIAVYRMDHGRAVPLERCAISGRYSSLEITPQRELANVGLVHAGSRGARAELWELVTTQFLRAIVPAGSRRYLTGSCGGSTHVVRAVSIGTATRVGGPKGAPTLLDIELQPLSTEPRPLWHRGILPRSREAREVAMNDGICSPGDSAACMELCRAGSARSCYNVGLLRKRADESSSARAAAAEFFQAACAASVPEACSEVGQAYAATAAGQDQAAPYYARACEGGDAFGCYRRGKLASLKYDPTRSDAILPWYERACRGGSASGCEELAGWIRAVAPQRFAMEDIELLKHFERACKAGLVRACDRWARMLEEGRGSPQNRTLAEDIHGFACRHGWLKSCQLLEKRGVDDAGNPEFVAR